MGPGSTAAFWPCRLHHCGQRAGAVELCYGGCSGLCSGLCCDTVLRRVQWPPVQGLVLWLALRLVLCGPVLLLVRWLGPACGPEVEQGIKSNLD